MFIASSLKRFLRSVGAQCLLASVSRITSRTYGALIHILDGFYKHLAPTEPGAHCLHHYRMPSS